MRAFVYLCVCDFVCTHECMCVFVLSYVCMNTHKHTHMITYTRTKNVLI